MSLTGRLSAFFLAALALVLLGFSATLYFLAHSYLYRQMEVRLEGALDTLVAAVDVDAAGVEWEPHERFLTLGQADGADQVRWIIRDEQGQIKDRSTNVAPDDFAAIPWPAYSGQQPGFRSDQAAASWRFLQRRIGRNAANPPQ